MKSFGSSGYPAWCLPALIGLVLVGVTIIAYFPTKDHDFVAYDDPVYVSENAIVQRGLTVSGGEWALTTDTASNWHPLTWLSLMLDCQLFGVKPGPMHVHNVAYHAISGFLVFWILRRVTGATWRSALAAAIFAWHPLRVESVAWIAERKDILSTFFWLLTLWAWLRFLERRTVGRYAITLTTFILGLMSKPMVVGLPLALFIVDFWPLGRLRQAAPPARRSRGKDSESDVRSPLASYWSLWKPLVIEKAPLLALAFAAGLITLYVQRRGGAMTVGDPIPLMDRVLNGVVAYAEYLRKLFWPHDLAVFYPHPYPERWSPLRIATASAAIASVTALAVWQRQARPYLLAGWLWYLVTLLPVLGLVQVGAQAWADRYTYVPMIGVAIMLAWASAEIAERWRFPTAARAGLVAVALMACVTATIRQVHYWQDTLTLFTHALEVTENNYRAHKEVADVYDSEKQFALAQHHYEEAVRINPKFFHAQMNFGIFLFRQSNYRDAAQHFLAATQINANSPEAHANLGAALSGTGDLDEAIVQAREALRLRPNYPTAQRNLAKYLAAAAARR